MKRFSLRSLFVLSAFILVVLSGCVSTINAIIFNFPSDKLSNSEQLFVRFSDGSIAQAPYTAGASAVTVNNTGGKTFVGGYVSDGIVSWVPDYSYPQNTWGTVIVSGIDARKPVNGANHVKLAKPPETSGEYVNVTFAVYDVDGQPSGDRTEIFAHSADSSLTFFNTDPDDKNNGGFYTRRDTVDQGYSWYTVDGVVTFMIKSNISDIHSKPISLYSGSKLISNDPFYTGTNLVTAIDIGTSGNASSLRVGDTLAMSAGILPVEATNKVVTWSVENGTGAATINANGVLTGTSAGTVTVKAAANDRTATSGSKIMTIQPPPVAFAGGSGTLEDPFQIANAEQLDEVRNHLDTYLYYKLIANITSFPNVDGGWMPIGDNEVGFQGNMDGNGFAIRNLVISRSGNSYIGLFGVTLSNSELNNIILENIEVHGGFNVGGLVGYNGGTISKSSVTGSVKGSSTVGGLVGENQGIVSTSFSSANASGDYTAGGLVGSNSSDGVINNSYATGTAYGYYGIGGLTGFNNGTISNSYAIGSVQGHPNSSPNNLGGLTPYSGTEILDSFYNIETTGRSDTGKGTGATTEAMKSQQTYVQWDFASIWGIHASRNNGYPYLRNVQLFVEYNGNGSTGGTTPTDNSSYYKGKTVNVYSQALDLVKEGYTFAGWNTSADGSGTSYAAGAPFTITGDTILYAKWRENGPVVVPVTGITVSGVTYTVYVNNTLQLNAVITPNNATNAGITWTLRQGTGNASITSTGLLTGMSAGTVTVTATSVEDAAIQASAVVTVLNREETSTPPSGGPSTSPPVTEIKPDPKPETKPETKPEVKFNDTVVKLTEVLANLNKKIEETKTTPNVKFRDTASHWADSTVSIFVKLGVVNGYADGSFRPNASITRAEFATILAKVFNLTTSGSGNKLSDASGHWAESSINALTANGIISGYEDGTFKPNREITRAEIISMISKILTIKAAGGVPTTSAFTDINGVWNKEQIEAAASVGLISGMGNGLFSPNKQSTRAEALTILLHVLQANPELNTLLGSIK
ncbi:S-layer homology domain-containing protein [Paenibacillus sp. HWE-109]|uniref:S-layer homology domain-containing protein n=1 Tax=Paenibacillus sp. HWE-109 TaxID=1306526 RepID=UPI001EDD7B09|nr:S-layer homology domain-containing protein [Paenibacillus sp. HWE-109]UKS25922.1 S-layer homology domain-containing protein [Paenibacillus sp. HWE-109]